jgi:hypothetical protein
MLLNDIELEGFIAKKLMYLNLLQERKKYKIGQLVMVAHLKTLFEKKRYNREPGDFAIDGYKNRMYIVKDDKDHTLEVPGFYLQKY